MCLNNVVHYLFKVPDPNVVGYNLKVTDMQAAIGCEQLKKLPGFIEDRKKNWSYLKESLMTCQDKLVLPEAAENGDPSGLVFWSR